LGGVSLIFFAIAAFFEIAGCFAFWMWLRSGRSGAYAALGVISLVCFALVLTRVDASFAGRAFAAYGGIYIATSLIWLRAVEGVEPNRWDLVGGFISIMGALVIIFAPRAPS
jgi:small multidrug resistance family-3 protein